MDVLAFVEGLAARVSIWAFSRVATKLPKLKLWSLKWVYRRELRDSLKEMPFLYRNVLLDTRDGFVEIEMDSVNRRDLYSKPVEKGYASPQPMFERLRNSQRAIFFGEAGIGKTTLFRYSVLAILGSTQRAKSLCPDPEVFPIYIPLKAIDNQAASPIVRYIINNIPYFGGKVGYFKLKRLARRSKLFLFLDGYDEVPIVGRTSFVQAELEILLSNQVPKYVFDSSKSEYRDIYEAFLGCRVWMSTRREFFIANGFDIPFGTGLWFVRGLGQHRAALVQRIFDKHIEAEPEIWGGRLSAERFMQQLKVTADSSLEELSKNPLFLTIMCFVYVHDLRDEKSPELIWRKGIDALIERCINALLSDIDSAKARGLSAIERDALMGRRAAWMPQKMEFLEFLAATALLENIPLFRRHEIEARALSYFTGKIGLEYDDILRGMSSHDGTSNIALQLIYSGLLTLVEKVNQEDFYDFPHRRFKEVLGRRYLRNESGCRSVCACVHDKSLSEFILLYFKGTTWRPMVLEALSDGCMHSDLDEAYRVGNLTAECLKHANMSEKLAFLRRLLSCLEFVAEGRYLPKTILDEMAADDQTNELLERLLCNSIRTNRLSLFQLVSGPIKRLSSVRLGMLVSAVRSIAGSHSELGVQLLKLCVSTNPKILQDVLSAGWSGDKSEWMCSALFRGAYLPSGKEDGVGKVICSHLSIDMDRFLSINAGQSIGRDADFSQAGFDWK